MTSVSGSNPNIKWDKLSTKQVDVNDKSDNNIALVHGSFGKEDVEGALKSGKKDVYISDDKGRVVGKISMADLKESLESVKSNGKIDYGKFSKMVISSNNKATGYLRVVADKIDPETVGNNPEIRKILKNNGAQNVTFSIYLEDSKTASKISTDILKKNGFDVNKFNKDPEYKEKVIDGIAALMPDVTDRAEIEKFAGILFGNIPLDEDNIKFMQEKFTHVKDVSLKEILSMPNPETGNPPEKEGIDGKFAMRTVSSIDTFAIALNAKINNPLSNIVLISGTNAKSAVLNKSETIAINAEEDFKFRNQIATKSGVEYSDSYNPGSISTPNVKLDKNKPREFVFYIGGHNTVDEANKKNVSPMGLEGYNGGTSVTYGIKDKSFPSDIEKSIRSKTDNFMDSHPEYGLFDEKGNKATKGATTDGNYTLKLPSYGELKKAGFTDEELTYLKQNAVITFQTPPNFNTYERIYITGQIQQ